MLEDTSEDRQTLLTITGMTCGACVRHVTAALRRVPGVRDARVQVRPGAAEVRHAPGTSPAELCAAVEAAGYGAAVGP